ncbi:ATP-binding cassette transporter YOR1 [Ascoidea rubescens DSM 1968]|uniref:p-loop containing nucleoside triphosphate hydrolase protein n=1 Tax=Ascoidea rubescens DSM 1968 TaxID=1344418 RepID=A0A1D2VJH6_9ASCO|nr:P-loop containing nucleoside triphosphate hydrolase protein [Ascoidea rubescens DSM 1968]ODV61657.1 P-loop containing nucleoside triphosphate hydrolase protein [Ascoidea rubescens DSM 1968]
MNIVFKIQFYKNIFISAATTLPALSAMLCFAIIYKINGGHDAVDIFASLSLFHVLSQLILMFPIAVGGSADAVVTCKRVSDVLSSSEIKKNVMAELKNERMHNFRVDSCMAIQLRNASFKWDEIEEESLNSERGKNSENDIQKQSKVLTKTLKKVSNAASFKGLIDINLDIKKGELVIVTGFIGSGKSSLLAALADFMKKEKGIKSVNDSLIFCGYSWAQNETIKNNILFGKEYDEKKYLAIIHACDLLDDLKVFPAGDETEIGERGITLSGGQRARINLARAVYHDANIILLDDVLSAVDAKVGKHIMKYCILGLLKNKTRILATHQLSVIENADKIIFLNGKGGLICGTIDKIQTESQDFNNLIAFQFNSYNKVNTVIKESLYEKKELLNQTVQDVDGHLMVEEERAVNKISKDVYYHYVTEGSGCFKFAALPIFMLLIIIQTFCNLFINTWLSFWVEDRFDKSGNFYIGIYVMVNMAFVFFTILEFSMILYITNMAARQLTIKAIAKVLHAPMSFLDTAPMGRILNRFTKDSDSLDNLIGDEFRVFIICLSSLIGVIILCIIYLPWFAISLPFFALLFVSVSSYYQASAREINRLEALNRSYVISNISECLGGRDTIRAYNAMERFKEKNSRYIDLMNEASYITISNQRWLAVHLDMLGILFSLIISLLCVTRQFSVTASSAGLLISYVFSVTGGISMVVRTMTSVENSMNSAERLSYYAFDLPQEPPYYITEMSPPSSWPSRGEIIFKNASLRYREGLPLVLKSISFCANPGEKIGICGRTGAGKSSIMTALYRLAEISEGKILIDGIDISKLGLKDLRSKLSIIPQDPVLFKGTIRSNLDPFNECLDDDLWDALVRGGLIEEEFLGYMRYQEKYGEIYESVNKFHLNRMKKFGLNESVEDNGLNFSLGERQLLALSRALVRNSKILIMDEATSSVDYETDSKIQETIYEQFSDCTILCIAHRLKTISNYDKIMVLENGEIVEFDTPKNLYDKTNSIFREMCDESGITVF